MFVLGSELVKSCIELKVMVSLKDVLSVVMMRFLMSSDMMR